MMARNATRVPLRAVSGNGNANGNGRLASPAKKRLGQALAYGSGKARATDAPAADVTPTAAAVMAPKEAADLARKLCADIMGRSKVPAEADARLEMAKAVMIELCAGLMARGAISMEVATSSGCAINGELLPHIESFMGWVQSGFLDSITMSDGALLRAKCGEVNREIDVLLKSGEVRKFVSALRPKEEAPDDAVTTAKNRVQAHQAGKSPVKARRRSPVKRSARASSQTRANSAPPTTEAAAHTCSNGSDVATKPRVATSRPKVWAPPKPSGASNQKPLAPVPPSDGRARSARSGRRPATAGNAASTKSPPKQPASMGKAVEIALKSARAGEKRRRAQLQRELSAEAARKSGRSAGQQPEPIFESWKEKGKLFAAASDSFRRNTEATLQKIAQKNKHSGVEDLKAEMAKLKGPGPTRPPSSRAASRAGNARKPTTVPPVSSLRPRDAYDEFVAAFQQEQQEKKVNVADSPDAGDAGMMDACDAATAAMTDVGAPVATEEMAASDNGGAVNSGAAE